WGSISGAPLEMKVESGRGWWWSGVDEVVVGCVLAKHEGGWQGGVWATTCNGAALAQLRAHRVEQRWGMVRRVARWCVRGDDSGGGLCARETRGGGGGGGGGGGERAGGGGGGRGGGGGGGGGGRWHVLGGGGGVVRSRNT